MIPNENSNKKTRPKSYSELFSSRKSFEGFFSEPKAFHISRKDPVNYKIQLPDTWVSSPNFAKYLANFVSIPPEIIRKP